MAWRKTIGYIAICGAAATVFSGCVEPFDAEVSASQLDILIIDGYINVGPGETRITLSKVSALDQEGGMMHEEGADVRIENNAGEAFLLNETEDGIYTSDNLNLPADKQYRLYVSLSNGKEYSSELQTPKITPPIDSVHWEYKPDLLYIYSNSHDATNATRYYRWAYQEDWQIKTPFKSELKYDKNENPPIFERPDPEMLDMHNCWKKIKSNGLIFGSTAVLTNDVIKFPVVTIPHSSERISVKYSIIVNQHTITQAEFNYLTLMNKNSTQTGSFFDPMPSQLFGNIKRMDDPDETVIGYVGVYTTVQATLFILEDELPPSDVSQLACETITFLNTFDNRETYLGGARPPYVPLQLFEQEGNPMIVAMPTKGCMDCRSDTTGPRPDYW
jgi:Domain of unknown function (DUF4249)